MKVLFFFLYPWFVIATNRKLDNFFPNPGKKSDLDSPSNKLQPSDDQTAVTKEIDSISKEGDDSQDGMHLVYFYDYVVGEDDTNDDSKVEEQEKKDVQQSTTEESSVLLDNLYWEENRSEESNHYYAFVPEPNVIENEVAVVEEYDENLNDGNDDEDDSNTYYYNDTNVDESSKPVIVETEEFDMDPPENFSYKVVSMDEYQNRSDEDDLNYFFYEAVATFNYISSLEGIIGQSLASAIEYTLYEWLENLMIMMRWGSFEPAKRDSEDANLAQSSTTIHRRNLRGSDYVDHLLSQQMELSQDTKSQDINPFFDDDLKGYSSKEASATASSDTPVYVMTDDLYYIKNDYFHHPEKYKVEMPLTTFLSITGAIFLEGCLICLLVLEFYAVCKKPKRESALFKPLVQEIEHEEA